VSRTFQTTTAAISTGFPCWSFTLIRSPFRLLARSESFLRVMNGFVHHQPLDRTDPT